MCGNTPSHSGPMLVFGCNLKIACFGDILIFPLLLVLFGFFVYGYVMYKIRQVATVYWFFIPRAVLSIWLCLLGFCLVTLLGFCLVSVP